MGDMNESGMDNNAMNGVVEEKKEVDKVEEPQGVEEAAKPEEKVETESNMQIDEEETPKDSEEEEQQTEKYNVEEVGFAKLKGTNGLAIEYIIKKYAITIGRKSKSTPVDVVLGDSMSISRNHATIEYNFQNKCWELAVRGKNGVSVGKILYTPSSAPVTLRSQDLLQFGDKNAPVSMYFLLPRTAAN